MRGTTLIVGQGLAGTLLAWEMERAGWAFEIADPGHETSASRIAAGIINPITGQRFVKSWMVERCLPLARATYQGIEHALGVGLWREMRVRRLFRTGREGALAGEKWARGDFGSYVDRVESDGFWIEGAAHVDTAALIACARKRWEEQGRLRPERVDLRVESARYEVVIDCRGAAAAEENPAGEALPWEFSQGESLVLAIPGLEPNVILNRGLWVLPVSPGVARVGSTHAPGQRDRVPTPAGRASLEAGAAEIARRDFLVTAHEAGVRVYLPDRRPVMGWLNGRGVFNGLGAKGALYAPLMAQAWIAHLGERVPFAPELDVARFGQWNGSERRT